MPIYLMVTLVYVLLNRWVLTPEDLRAELVRQVAAEIAPYHHFTPEGICPFTNEQWLAFDEAAKETLAHLLVASAAKDFTLDELETIFKEGMRAAVPDVWVGGAELMAEHQEYVLANLYGLYCAQSSRQEPSPYLVVFNRLTGEIWDLTNSAGGSLVRDVRWIEDRWVGMTSFASSDYSTTYWFVHIVPVNGEWKRLVFENIPHAPNLSVYSFEPLRITYRDGWRTITLSTSNMQHVGTILSNSPPCDFGDNLSQIPTQLTCDGCISTFYNALYTGHLTYIWDGDGYVLTGETPYTVTVLLNDYTTLYDVPPTAAELAKNPRLRPESWREYCLDND